MTFKNEAQLKKFLSEKCAKAVDSAKEKVYEEFAGNLNQFYAEYKPEEYIRTNELFNSLEVVGVKRIGNQHMSRVEAEIYFNELSYDHGWIPLQSGGFGYSYWTDDYIQDVVMTSKFPHGGYEGGTAIWNDSMKSLGGGKGIKNLLIQELKRQGL
jgi:hypothetical protein